jgi:hypothetical protein
VSPGQGKEENVVEVANDKLVKHISEVVVYETASKWHDLVLKQAIASLERVFHSSPLAMGRIS